METLKKHKQIRLHHVSDLHVFYLYTKIKVRHIWHPLCFIELALLTPAMLTLCAPPGVITCNLDKLLPIFFFFLKTVLCYKEKLNLKLIHCGLSCTISTAVTLAYLLRLRLGHLWFQSTWTFMQSIKMKTRVTGRQKNHNSFTNHAG